MRKRHLAIVGATGVVGQELIRLIIKRNFAFDKLSLYASMGDREIMVNDLAVPVRPLSEANFSDVDIAFFTAGTSASIEAAEMAAGQGALVIDNTNVFRMRDDVPLIVPQINMDDAQVRPASNIIANPNCSTIPVVRVMDILCKRWGVEQLVVSTYQAASGAGQLGIDALNQGNREFIRDQSNMSCEVFGTQLAGNLIPHIDEDLASGHTMEEQKMRQETRKILHEDQLTLNCTCVRVPVVNSHSAAVYARFDNSLNLDEVVAHLREGPDLSVHFDARSASFPEPRKVSGNEAVHIGRLRVDDEDDRALLFWVVSDNLLVGAALNAIQIAEGIDQWGWA